MKGELRRILLEAIIIATFGAMIGLSVNHRLVLSALEGKGSAPAPSPVLPQSLYPSPVGLSDVQEVLRKEGLAVDARDRESYRQGHIPGAHSLPFAEVEKELPSFRKDVPADKTLVVYCSGYGCTDSFDLGVRLLGGGYRDVRVFEGGFPAWHDAGLPVEKGNP